MTSIPTHPNPAVAVSGAAKRFSCAHDHLGRIVLLLLLFVCCLNTSSIGTLSVALGLFALGLLVIGLKDPRFLMLTMIALVPLRPPVLSFGTVLGFQLTFNRILAPIAVLCFLACRSSFPARERQREPLLYFLLAILALSVVTDLLGDGSFQAGIQRTVSESVEVMLFAYVCYRIFPASELASVCSAFATGGILLCASCVLEHLANVDLLFRFPVRDAALTEIQDWNWYLMMERGGGMRVRGPYTSPVDLAAFLPLLLFCAIYLVLVQRRRFLGGALLILVLLTACFSISRTALYALAISGLPVLLVWLRGKGIGQTIKYAMIGLLVLLLLVAVFPGDFQRAYDLVLNPHEESLGGQSTQDRMDLITLGVPFVLGLNPFGAGGEKGTGIAMLLGPDIADFYIGYSITRGVIWVGMFCWMLIYLMWRLWRIKDFVSRMLFWLVVSITATYFSYAEYWITFPMLLVFILIHIGHRSTESLNPPLKAARIARI